MSNEEYQSETLLLTIKAQLEREEAQNKRIWANLWYGSRANQQPRPGLMKYFEPSYPAAHDELCQPCASYNPTDPK
jgi:hypothetical protein